MNTKGPEGGGNVVGAVVFPGGEVVAETKEEKNHLPFIMTSRPDVIINKQLETYLSKFKYIITSKYPVAQWRKSGTGYNSPHPPALIMYFPEHTVNYCFLANLTCCFRNS